MEKYDFCYCGEEYVTLEDENASYKAIALIINQTIRMEQQSSRAKFPDFYESIDMESFVISLLSANCPLTMTIVLAA